MNGISRRTFLAASAAVVVASSCGSGQSYGALYQFFDDTSLRPGQPQRLVFGLGDKENVVLEKGGPATMTLQVATLDGKAVGGGISAIRRDKNLPRPYWAITTILPAAGTYQVSTKLGGKTLTANFQIPATSAVPAAGEPMVPVETPTPTNGHGVSQMCTRDPACPLHEVTLTAALKEGKPVALLIGTPAYCQTQVCGPVLELLLAQAAKLGDKIRFLHAEVYAQPYVDPSTPTSPAVQAYNLSYEPALFLAGSDGVIRERLDVIYDSAELEAALAKLS
ncbi:MAG: hypothetical protein ABJD24_00360 [Acidimicrobiales bacterium]